MSANEGTAVEQISALLGGQEPDAPAPDDTPETEHQDDGVVGGEQSGAEQNVQGESDAHMAQDTEEEQDTDDSGNAEPVTVAGLAEQLGIDAKDLYDELVIPLPDSAGGGSITLGEFKDRIPELRDLDTARAEHQEATREYEKGQLRDRALLNQMLAMMGDQAKPLYEKAAQDLESWQAQQRDLLIDAIPGWQDPDTLARDRDAILKVGAEYGFSEEEMAYTQDARTVRMLKDFADMRAEKDAAKAISKRSKAKPGRPGRPNRNGKNGALATALAKAKQSKDIGDKAEGVAAILRNM